MKGITITFDRKSNLWTSDQQFNTMALLKLEQIINDIIRRKGYMYLNQIYEYLGVEWNPTRDNVCFIKGSKKQRIYVEFELFNMPDGSILVYIHHY